MGPADLDEVGYDVGGATGVGDRRELLEAQEIEVRCQAAGVDLGERAGEAAFDDAPPVGGVEALEVAAA